MDDMKPLDLNALELWDIFINPAIILWSNFFKIITNHPDFVIIILYHQNIISAPIIAIFYKCKLWYQSTEAEITTDTKS